jgi:sugar lactone lactonase YvrE
VEQPESGIGKGYLSAQGWVDDVSVDAAGQEIYVANGTQVVVYGLDGMYHRVIAVTRETSQVCFRAGVLYVGGRNAIYNYEWTYGHVQAVDPLSGTVLGTEDAASQTTNIIGNWVLPNSIRFTSGGLMLRGDLSLPRVEVYQPNISSSYYQSSMSIAGPLMSLQNNGPFAVNGTVNVYNIASWMLQLGKTNSLTGIFNPLLTVASGVSNTSGALGSADLTQMPDGVYSLRLTATNTSGANIVTSTAVSKGEWQYTGMLTGISPANGYVASAEYPKIGHDYIAAAPIWGGDYKAHILELNQNGQYVAENTYSDFNVLRGLAVDGDNLIVSGMENDGGSNSYMSGAGRAFVRSFNLASADGQGLGTLTPEYDGMSSPTGLVAVNGVVYVAEFSANKIVELPENNLAAGPIGTIQSIYLSADWSMDIAVDRVPGSEELYVGNGQGVVVFDLQGTFHRQFSWNFTVGGLWFDTSTGILYVVDVTNQQVVAYNGQTGAFLGRTETRQDSTQLDGQFTQPTYLKQNSSGSLMVGNWLQNRVQLIKPNFTAVRTIVWPTVTNTPTISPTYSSTPTVTASLTCTMTPTSSVSASATPSATATPTASQSPTWSSSPTMTVSATSTATPTACVIAPNTVAVYYFAPGAGCITWG